MFLSSFVDDVRMSVAQGFNLDPSLQGSDAGRDVNMQKYDNGLNRPPSINTEECPYEYRKIPYFPECVF